MEDCYYVYYKEYKENKLWVYERTCGTEEAAKERISYLKTIYDEAIYTKNSVIKNSYI